VLRLHARVGLSIVTNAAARLFGAENMTVSPQVPVVTLRDHGGEGPELAQDEHVGCCFVAA